MRDVILRVAEPVRRLPATAAPGQHGFVPESVWLLRCKELFGLAAGVLFLEAGFPHVTELVCDVPSMTIRGSFTRSILITL